MHIQHVANEIETPDVHGLRSRQPKVSRALAAFKQKLSVTSEAEV